MAEPITVFDWEEMAGDTVCGQVATLAGAAATPPARLRPLLGSILAGTGGLPAVLGDPDPVERDALALRLLREGLRHVLAELGYLVEQRGHTVSDNRVTANDLVDANSADAARLDALPVIGAVTAARIVADRRTNGPFRSPADLAARIPGLSQDGVSRLRGALTFTPPTAAARTLPYGALSLGDCLAALTASRRGDPETRLVTALDAAAVICAGSPHPATVERRIANPVTRTPVPHAASSVQLLNGSAYFRELPGLFAAATASIDVAMFHIAFAGPSHPTRALLDALVDAHDRGVTVRVLVDADRPTDPYKSTVINRPAVEFLQTAGVSTRTDDAREVLHSKFVVIDDARAVVGSHNWSAGSYFHFDDHSVLIDSAGFGGQLAQRFQVLWDEAAP